MHRNTAAGFYTRLRHVIAEELATASPVAGEVEVDGGVPVGGRDLHEVRLKLACDPTGARHVL